MKHCLTMVRVFCFSTSKQDALHLHHRIHPSGTVAFMALVGPGLVVVGIIIDAGRRFSRGFGRDLIRGFFPALRLPHHVQPTLATRPSRARCRSRLLRVLACYGVGEFNAAGAARVVRRQPAFRTCSPPELTFLPPPRLARYMYAVVSLVRHPANHRIILPPPFFK